MKPSAAQIVRKTALDPLYGLWSGGRTHGILIGSRSDAAHQKARYVQRYMRKRRFYAAVAEPGAAFNIRPTQYDVASWRREEVWVGVYAEFFALSSRDMERASTQVSLVRLAAILRHAQAGYARIANAADAIHVAQPPSPS